MPGSSCFLRFSPASTRSPSRRRDFKPSPRSTWWLSPWEPSDSMRSCSWERPARPITVEAAPPVLHTDDATLGSTMENDVYAALPLAMNGVPRDPTQFVGLVPGVDNSSTQAAGPSTAAFNGGQTYQNEVYLEGLPLTSAGTEGDTRYLAFAVSVDAVDQFQVETNGAKAQYQGQGVENYVIKSGTNSFHGAAFEYFRNTDLDARGFFPAIRPVERQNEYGGLIGGPIKKNKIFFFTNYDGYRYDSGLNPTLAVHPDDGRADGRFQRASGPDLRSGEPDLRRRGLYADAVHRKHHPHHPHLSDLAIVAVLSPRSDEHEHPEQLPAQPAHPGEHVQHDRQGGRLPVGQAPAVRVLRQRALRHQFHRQPQPNGSRRAARAVYAGPHRGGIRQNGAVARYLHHHAHPFEPIQLFLQPHLDSASKPHHKRGLSAEGRHQGLAAECGRRHFPGHHLQRRHQCARQLAGNQRPLLQRSRQHVHRARQRDVGEGQAFADFRRSVPGIAGQRELRVGRQPSPSPTRKPPGTIPRERSSPAKAMPTPVTCSAL